MIEAKGGRIKFECGAFDGLKTKFELAEFNTHRVFSRNSASSRAIPIKKTLDKIEADPAFPILWNSEKPGMQGGESLTGQALLEAEGLFLDIRNYTVDRVYNYLEACELGGSNKLHKAYLNRLLEPFLWHKVIVSSTEWGNFFEQRISELALPEIADLAICIKNAMYESEPVELHSGEWHLPYADDIDEYTAEELILISAARCARVSYETHDGVRDIGKDLDLAYKLMSAKPMHYSPFEHQARAEYGDYGWSKSNFSNCWIQARTMLEESGKIYVK